MLEYRHSLVVGNGEPHFSLAYTSLARNPLSHTTLTPIACTIALKKPYILRSNKAVS